MPDIYQRYAGGRRAKIPEIDLDLEMGIDDGTTKNEDCTREAIPEVTSIKLRWTMLEADNRRVLALNTGTPDVGLQEPYLQRRRVRWQ